MLTKLPGTDWKPFALSLSLKIETNSEGHQFLEVKGSKNSESIFFPLQFYRKGN
jgi:hypothetical protein